MKIVITGTTLQTPNETITNCWEDRSSGLLSGSASLAVMPFLNAEERGNSAVSLTVDNQDAVFAAGVEEEGPIVGLAPRTGSVYVRTLSDLETLLGIK